MNDPFDNISTMTAIERFPYYRVGGYTVYDNAEANALAQALADRTRRPITVMCKQDVWTAFYSLQTFHPIPEEGR